MDNWNKDVLKGVHREALARAATAFRIQEGGHVVADMTLLSRVIQQAMISTVSACRDETTHAIQRLQFTEEDLQR